MPSRLLLTFGHKVFSVKGTRGANVITAGSLDVPGLYLYDSSTQVMES
jgi:hypothetical protein